MKQTHPILLLILPLLPPTTASPHRPPAFAIRPRVNTGQILKSCRPTNGHEIQSPNNAEQLDRYKSNESHRASHIVSITSNNIAGMKSDTNDEIVVRFTPSHINDDRGGARFVAITGESGSGKSVLVSKAIDLATGGKATGSLLPEVGVGGESTECCVELVANLYEPHLSAISSSLQQYGVNPEILHTPNTARLHLSRSIQRTADSSGRIKSTCRINGKHVSLKTLRAVSSPLFTRVDVATASSALSRSSSRLGMIDIGVSGGLKRRCLECRNEYDRAKRRRRKIEKELEERVVPAGISRSGDGGAVSEEEMELLRHWVDELDMFESRINTFREAILMQYNELMSDDNNSSDIQILRNFQSNTWANVETSEDASLFANLLEFREEIKSIESKLTSAHSAYELLSSLSSPDSAALALEKVRKLLYTISRDNTGPLFDSIEKSHEMLNAVEEALNDCARTIDGDSNSVISTLEKSACTGISLEQIDTIVADWNALARKHGISPYLLPKCHESLRQELDGNAEAMMLLPGAKEDEEVALRLYSEACKELSVARCKVADSLSESVSNLLPSLCLEGTTFQVDMGLRQGGFEDPYYGSESIGVDIADFLLLHRKSVNASSSDMDAIKPQSGGYIDQVGSSGEKSRVLLAIETALPGSIGTACNSFSSSSEGIQLSLDVAPIAIIFDEIDAHVGGRAAVTMAKLLAEQTRRQSDSSGSQIIAITHSASVAAIADEQIVVERSTALNGESSSLVRAFAVEGSVRRKEIARMAAGDLAVGEAEAFADALIRDALLQRDMP